MLICYENLSNENFVKKFRRFLICTYIIPEFLKHVMSSLQDAFDETLGNMKSDKKRAVEEAKEALEILQQPRDDLDDNAQGTVEER